MRFRCERLPALAWDAAVVLVVLSASIVTAVAQEPVTLRPGIVIDPAANVIYAMTPGGITAVDLKSGAKRWTTTAAAKPLALSGDLLISQVEPKKRTSILELATLNTNQRGVVTARSTTELPDNVRVAIGQTLEGRFDTEALTSDKNAVVKWTFESRERRLFQGRREEAERTPVTNETAAANAVPPVRSTAPSATQGILSVDLKTGATVPAETDAFRAAMITRLPTGARGSLNEVSSNEQRAARIGGTVSGTPHPTYESADKRHVLVSERIGNDETWAKYRWTVYEKGSDKRIGEFRTHLAFAPFVVSNSTLIYESTPYVKDGKEEPAKLRGINLSTGQEAWSVEVRENVFRGPFPP